MPRLTLDVPDDLQSKLRARAAENGHASLELYLEALLRSEAEVADAPDEDYGAPAGVTVSSEEELEAALLEGLASGPAREVTAGEWDSIRQEVAERLAANRRSRS
jgi:plasmid stability protein